MASKNDEIQKVIDWAKLMGEKGIFEEKTVENKIRALQNIVSVLGTDESKDPEYILEAISDITQRWARKTNPTPSSIQTTKSHSKRILEDYLEYQKNPASFKPSVRGVGRKKAELKKPPGKKGKKEKKDKDDSSEITETERPSININIEIHISAETTEKQIDKIFESMSKYIPFKKT